MLSRRSDVGTTMKQGMPPVQQLIDRSFATRLSFRGSLFIKSATPNISAGVLSLPKYLGAMNAD